ncbi:alpha/beta hydrolase family protein [Natronorubrum sulfidifaciens]|uniref:Palmitoyl-protein thioesterase ABHD10, mitochondrial n=1 Tax=Natronorubrum sulfidifaciens JCM 14089 TaxID=1230460 RepID=L9WMP4_9EURY|nr:alpha/beta fold hydrolase [Natronorubrum sulfidifaciens]ELY49598.1 alpha/beta hydrolase fold protein [Natronorubrum sulfidifaciens JCM 14089]
MTETTHRIPVANGEAVAAVHHDAPSDNWLVFCHGFLSDKHGSYEHRCQRAVEEGYNAVRFDFRGCGESDGRFVDQTLSTKLADLRAVVDQFDPESYVLFGSSFGGKVAFHAAVQDPRIEAVVTRAPVTYNDAFEAYRTAVEHDGEYQFETGDRIDQRFFEDFETYRFADVEAELDVPVAIFHGRADDSVDIAHSLEAVAQLETDVLFEAFATDGHRFSRPAEARLLERLYHWLETQ